jgi:hypothetical protein
VKRGLLSLHLLHQFFNPINRKLAAAIQSEVEALEKRSQTEEARWDKEKERLETALRRARG